MPFQIVLVSLQARAPMLSVMPLPAVQGAAKASESVNMSWKTLGATEYVGICVDSKTQVNCQRAAHASQATVLPPPNT